MARESGFTGTKPSTGGNNTRLEDLVDLYKIPNEWGQVRFLPEITSYYVFWITTKDKEGNKAKPFPKVCLDYNPKTEEFDKEVCPYRKNQVGRGQKVYLANAVIRELQENEPRRIPKHTKKERRPEKNPEGHKVFRKEKDSSSWTPVRVVRLPSSLVKSLQNLRALNKSKGKTYDITDPRYGADVYLSHDPKVEGTQQYKVQLADQTKLTKEEFTYLRYPIYGLIQPESKSEAKEEYRRIKSRLWSAKDESSTSDTSDYLEDKGKKRKKKKKSSKKKKDDSSEINYSEDSSDIDLDESSEKPKKKKKSSKRNSKSSSSSKKKKSSRKKKRSNDSSDIPF